MTKYLIFRHKPSKVTGSRYYYIRQATKAVKSVHFIKRILKFPRSSNNLVIHLSKYQLQGYLEK